MKRTASGGKNSRSSGSSTGRKRRRLQLTGARSYVLCVKNEGYPASLDLGKLYRCLPDPRAGRHAMNRIVDESGEDYLYPADWFIEIPLPPAAKRRLSSITG
jgi:hypothetical protein